MLARTSKLQSQNQELLFNNSSLNYDLVPKAPTFGTNKGGYAAGSNANRKHSVGPGSMNSQRLGTHKSAGADADSPENIASLLPPLLREAWLFARVSVLASRLHTAQHQHLSTPACAMLARVATDTLNMIELEQDMHAEN